MTGTDGLESVAEMFGEDVFNDAAMRMRLPKKVYQALKNSVDNGT